jgi:thiamine-monophosphate kinase
MEETRFAETAGTTRLADSPEETRFADIGKVEAIRRLYAESPFKQPAVAREETPSKGGMLTHASVLLLEGIDFDLVYFPLKHLGYKSVVAVSGELLAALAHPRTLSVVLGISAKLDFAQIRQVWSGIVAGAREFGYKAVDLDMKPSRNGLTVSVSAVGLTDLLTERRRPAPKSKDLLCVSGNLGAAYLGLRLLEAEKKRFDASGEPSASPTGESSRLETYRMLVGAYLKPELPAGVIGNLEEAEIYPTAGCLITHGLADAVKRLCQETGLGAKIYADRIPFEGNSFQLGRELDVDPVAAAMNGGDDFKLLFAVPILQLEKFRRDFQTFDIIGHLAQPDAGTVLVTPEGVEFPVKAQGWKNESEA